MVRINHRVISSCFSYYRMCYDIVCVIILAQKLGFTLCCPDDIPISSGAPNFYDSSDYWFLSLDTVHHSCKERNINLSLHLLRVGQTVGCLVNTAGELHYYVDGEDRGVGWEGMPQDRPLWGFVDLYGWVTKIKLCGKLSFY